MRYAAVYGDPCDCGCRYDVHECFFTYGSQCSMVQRLRNAQAAMDWYEWAFKRTNCVIATIIWRRALEMMDSCKPSTRTARTSPAWGSNRTQVDKPNVQAFCDPAMGTSETCLLVYVLYILRNTHATIALLTTRNWTRHISCSSM